MMKSDNEIFNALVRCTGIRTSTTCLDCPYSPMELATIHFGEDVCTSALLRDLLSLICSRNAEIEGLQAVHVDINESLRLAAEANKDMQAEIERLKEHQKAEIEKLKEFEYMYKELCK